MSKRVSKRQKSESKHRRRVAKAEVRKLLQPSLDALMPIIKQHPALKGYSVRLVWSVESQPRFHFREVKTMKTNTTKRYNYNGEVLTLDQLIARLGKPWAYWFG